MREIAAQKMSYLIRPLLQIQSNQSALEIGMPVASREPMITNSYPSVASNEDSDVEREILSYLIEHPDAQDSIEGITQWWILERRIQAMLTSVQRIVDELAARQWLIQTKSHDEISMYRVNKEKLHEIQSYLHHH
jgi:hypothetical protein